MVAIPAARCFCHHSTLCFDSFCCVHFCRHSDPDRSRRVRIPVFCFSCSLFFAIYQQTPRETIPYQLFTKHFATFLRKFACQVLKFDKHQKTIQIPIAKELSPNPYNWNRDKKSLVRSRGFSSFAHNSFRKTNLPVNHLEWRFCGSYSIYNIENRLLIPR